MRICINYCTNCGAQYHWQASGSYQLVTPEKYNSDIYCPICYKAVKDALELIPIINEIKYVPTNEISLETILIWEKLVDIEKEEKSKISGWPIAKQIFPSMYNTVNKEHQRVGKVEGRDLFKNKTYMYSYWPSNMDEALITVMARVNIRTNEIVSYR